MSDNSADGAGESSATQSNVKPVKQVTNASGSTSGETSTHNPLKMRIDPLQLLNCLSILLNPQGAIKSMDEVQRVAGLMGKYSKKLVSKCIYLNILQATQEPLLDEFYKETGWNLVCNWLTEAVGTKNYPLAQQILSLLHASPITIDRLKRNNMPKMVKDLSKDCPHTGAREIAEKVVQRWKVLVQGCTGDGSMTSDLEPTPSETSSCSSGITTSPTPPPPPPAPAPVAPSTQITHTEEKDTPSAGSSVSDDVTVNPEAIVDPTPSTEENQTHEETLPVPRVTKAKGGRGRGSPTKGQRGVGRGRGRKRRGGGRGRAKQILSYAELLCQDINSSDGLVKEEEETKASPPPPPPHEASVPPIRIAIRNGVKVLPVGERSIGGKRKRTSVDSTDSDDNKPLSKIQEECRRDSPKREEEPAKEATPPPAPSSPTLAESKKDSEDESVPGENSAAQKDETCDDGEEVQAKKKKRNRVIIDDESDEEKEVETVEEKHESSPVPEHKKETGPKKKEEKAKVREHEEKGKVREHEDKAKVREHEEKEKKHKEKDKDRDREKDKERDRDKKRDKERRDSKGKDREKDKSKHKSSRDRDKDRDRDRDRKGKDKDRDKDRRRDSDEKERKKEQAEKDKATLDKVKPLSTEGLAKIPRKAPASQSKGPSAPVSFLDALGSADSDVPEVRRGSSLVKSKSRGFRNTGLLDETIKPPGVAGKRSSETVKRQNSHPGELPDIRKNIKASPSSAPPSGDRPGGVKLISPKRPHLADDGGFMAALTAAGADRKKIVRKRKSSEGDSRHDAAPGKSPRVDGTKDHSEEEGSMSPSKNNSEEEGGKKAEIEPGMLSPTSIKPIPNFYKDTLLDEPPKKEPSTKDDNGNIKSDITSSPDEVSSPPGKSSPETTSGAGSDSKSDEDNMEIDESDDNGKEDATQGIGGDGESENGDSTPIEGENNAVEGHGGIAGEDFSEAPVPAPAQEEYEKIEVTFSAPKEKLKGALVYHRSLNKRKKGVRWKPEAELKETFYFPMDETERVNVNTVKFNEMMMMEKAREKELMFGKHRNSSRFMLDGMEGGMQNTCLEFGPYKLYPIHLPNPPKITPGAKSIEKHVQAQREHATMAAFFHPAMLPESPTEPDPEMVQRTEPVIIPLNDVTGSDSVCDNRGIPWPEPLFNPPEFPFMGGSSGIHQGPPQQPGGHWVLGNHSVSRFGAGPPMFAGPTGPQGPMGNQGGLGPPPPQGFPGDMRGGWGGPADFGAPPVLIHNGPHMAMPGIGGPNPGMQGAPPTMPPGGPGMGMGGPPGPPMGNRDNYPRYRRGGGGNWGGGGGGGRGYCRHFRNGHCRNGDDCKFIHVPS